MKDFERFKNEDRVNKTLGLIVIVVFFILIAI